MKIPVKICIIITILSENKIKIPVPRENKPGHDAPLLQRVTGDLYMHYYIDIVAHTTAFDTPVVGHWLGKSLTQQYTHIVNFVKIMNFNNLEAVISVFTSCFCCS